MNELKAMLGKPDKNQDEDKKMAKMKALKGLKDHMSKSMGKGLMDGMAAKKVTVAAPDQEGLEKGLDKAKEVVAGEGSDDTGMAEMMEDTYEEADETAEQEVSEAIEKVSDPSEIDALMKMLEEKKKSLLTKV